MLSCAMVFQISRLNSGFLDFAISAGDTTATNVRSSVTRCVYSSDCMKVKYCSMAAPAASPSGRASCCMASSMKA